MYEESTQATEFKYRPLTKKIFYFSLVICILSILLLYRFHLEELRSLTKLKATLHFLLFSSVPLGILFRLLIVIRPRLFSRINLSGNSLNIAKVEIHFSQINEIAPSWVPPRLLGGFIMKLKDGRNIRISSLLQNSHIILERILKYDAQLISSPQKEKLLTSIQRADHYWKRVSIKFLDWKYLGAKYFLFPLFLSFFLYSILDKASENTTFLSELDFLEIYAWIFIIFLANSFAVGYFLESFLIYKESKHSGSISPNFEKWSLLAGELLSFLLLIAQIALLFSFTNSL